MVGLARNFSLIKRTELKLEPTVAIAFMFKESSVKSPLSIMSSTQCYNLVSLDLGSKQMHGQSHQ